jgi:hypothetical protein
MADQHTPRRRSRSRRPAPETLPDDLYFYLDTANDDQPAEPERRPKRARRRSSPPKDDPTTWRVVDDWPEKVPITEAEIEVFERYFADVFDRLFGPIEDPENALTSLSQTDNKKP